jgi:hypothetical protein
VDESPRERNREGVLRTIQVMRNWSLPGVPLLMTSRNELDIRQSLDPCCYHDLSRRNSEIDRDILNFVLGILRAV